MRPSQILNVKSDYEAFCFDEACLYILNKMRNEEDPHFNNEHNKSDSTNKSANEKTIEWMMKHSKPI